MKVAYVSTKNRTTEEVANAIIDWLMPDLLAPRDYSKETIHITDFSQEVERLFHK